MSARTDCHRGGSVLGKAMLAFVCVIAIVGLSMSAAGVDDGSLEVELEDDEPDVATNQTVEFSTASDSVHDGNEFEELRIHYDDVANLGEIDESDVTVEMGADGELDDIEEDGDFFGLIGGADLDVHNESNTLVIGLEKFSSAPELESDTDVEVTIEGIENPDVDVVDGYDYEVELVSDPGLFDDAETTNATTHYEVSDDGPNWGGPTPPTDPPEDGLDLTVDYNDQLEVDEDTDVEATLTNELDRSTTVDVTLEVGDDTWTDDLDLGTDDTETATFEDVGGDLEAGETATLDVIAASDHADEDETYGGSLTVADDGDSGQDGPAEDENGDDENGDDAEESQTDEESDDALSAWALNGLVALTITIWAGVLGLLAWDP